MELATNVKSVDAVDRRPALRPKVFKRRLPIGAEVVGERGIHFRLWAPKRRRVAVVIESSDGKPGQEIELDAEDNGYYSGFAVDARAEACYRYRLDGGQTLIPDPASRFQPEGPHGPSQVVDPSRYRWNDAGWQGCELAGQIIYEMHVGTFTREGTWQAAADQLSALAELGITVIEVMPVADFPGRFGWGYDGVDLFAPTRLYGSPDDMRQFVDRAHALGIAVILDVVYNHVGPDGNYLKEFSDHYFTDRYKNEWGEAINFDGPDSGPVREFVTANARYWIEEFHLDGLRLDATQQIFDSSKDHIMAELGRAVREAANGRTTILVAENERQESRLARTEHSQGYGLDGIWNDDFHHSLMVALHGRREAYYTDYYGTSQELLSSLKWGFLYQGQRYKWQKQRRGTPSRDLRPDQFITFLQNHDQVANSGKGLRCHALTSPGRFRALSALVLLGPGTPMLFQGQEFAASSPFLFFADHHRELNMQVRAGRAAFLAQFPSLALDESRSMLADPGDIETFERCKLNHCERQSHFEIFQLHRDLIKLRRTDPLLRSPRRGSYDGAVLSDRAFVLRYFDESGEDRLLVVNLGSDLLLDPAPEPLLAPPEQRRWVTVWSSEDPKYGGHGTPPLDSDESNWCVPAEAAVVLTGLPRE